ncbi:MAG: hypothetical protein A2Y77_11040 [Planctomycetes bacterium RBG_13_62_9]|nr:MAG: hypothetical protein A2Y77_11040 [Planctomycetes bacterium RBG_13_62_9]
MGNRKSDLRGTRRRVLLYCILLSLGSTLSGGDATTTPAAKSDQATPAASQSELVVDLKDTPVWEVDEQVRSYFIEGLGTNTQTTKSGEFKYPSFKSGTPLYGRTRVQFMEGDAVKSSDFHFALDHSQGQLGAYDLLYFDENGDGNLTNDNPRKPLKDAPKGLLATSSAKQQVCFESVRLSFDFGVEFGPKEDRPAFWWGGTHLDATHLLGRRYYRFSCTPTGSKLFLHPYEGPLGTLEVGTGGRKAEQLELRGSLRSKDTAVVVGDGLEAGWPKFTRRCELPVGDYYPTIVNVRLGDLGIEISNNYHIMIRGLDDMTHVETLTVTTADGRQREIKKARSLAPSVIIRRVTGKREIVVTRT